MKEKKDYLWGVPQKVVVFNFGVGRAYDYGVRWYDASIGRWTSVDPVIDNGFSTSPFAYVGGNPITFIDPQGKFRTRFGAWLYSVINDGEVVRSRPGAKRNHKWHVKSPVGDGSEAGLSVAYSWEKSVVKFGIDANVAFSITHAVHTTSADKGASGLSLTAGGVETRINLLSRDFGLGYGNRYKKASSFDVESIAGYDGESISYIQGKARIESRWLDLKFSDKVRYDFEQRQWIHTIERGFGRPGFEAKTIVSDNGHGEARVGLQEDWGKSIGRRFNYKLNFRFQFYAKW